jgi:hypothetical protein
VGLGQFSTSATVTTPAPSLPPAPTNLTLTPNATGFLATWTAPNVGSGPPLTGYVVRVVEAAGGTPTEQTVTAAQADLTGLAQATAYAIDVAATNEFGRGAFVSANGTTGATAGTPTPTPGESPTPRPTPTATPLPVSSPTPEPSASPDPAPAVVACNVPKLKGKSKAAAKKALRAANCSVGPIAGKRRGVVKTQLPKAGQVRPAGSRVALVLGKKKK